jgi:hypothetical protein
MSNLNTRLHPVGTSVVGLILLLVLVMLIRAPADTPRPMDATETADGGQASEPAAGIDGDSVQQAPGGTSAGAPAEADEPPLATGCFGSGSTRAEVRAVMGAPDSVVFGEWVYGRSGVTFGYGTVLDIRNEGRNLRVC